MASYQEEKLKAIDAENIKYQEMLEGFKDKRNPDVIKDFEATDYDYTPATEMEVESVPEDAIPDDTENNYNFIQDTGFTAYNTAKTVADYALETLPIAETVLNPFGKYSGPFDYFKNLGTTELENKDFVKIAKNQINNPEIYNYLEGYKQDFALTEDRVISHLNNELGLGVISLQDLKDKYAGNQEVADASTAALKNLEQQYLTSNDWYEDDDFYYIKNFKEMEGAPNVAWTRFGDLQMPNYGIFKFDEDGQGTMMRHSAVNLKDSFNPITSALGDLEFGAKPKHFYDLYLYGDPESQMAGMVGGTAISGIASLPHILGKGPGAMNRVKNTLNPYKRQSNSCRHCNSANGWVF